MIGELDKEGMIYANLCRYVCDLEERHLHERNAAFKRRMKEGFHMQRQQMVVRHAMVCWIY